MVVGISLVKDEVDIAAATFPRMLDQVDWVLVLDNGSTDGTRAVLDALDRVDVVDDPEPGYYQAAKITRLAQTAADAGAEWVVPFDADEVWYSPFGRLADVLSGRPDDAVATAAVYDHVATGADPAGPGPVTSMGWRRVEPVPLPKVACRPRLHAAIEQGNHGVRYPAGRVEGQLVVRHYPYRSPEQFVSKVRNGAAAYAATDLPEDQGKHWRDYGALLDAQGPEALHDVFRRWFWSPAPQDDPTLIFDPCPV